MAAVLVLGAPPGEGLVAAEPAGLVLIVRTIAAVLPEKRAAAVRTTAAVRPRPSASCPSRWRPLLVVDISNFLLLALGPDDGQTPRNGNNLHLSVATHRCVDRSVATRGRLPDVEHSFATVGAADDRDRTPWGVCQWSRLASDPTAPAKGRRWA